MEGLGMLNASPGAVLHLPVQAPFRRSRAPCQSPSEGQPMRGFASISAARRSFYYVVVREAVT